VKQKDFMKMNEQLVSRHQALFDSNKRAIVGQCNRIVKTFLTGS